MHDCAIADHGHSTATEGDCGVAGFTDTTFRQSSAWTDTEFASIGTSGGLLKPSCPQGQLQRPGIRGKASPGRATSTAASTVRTGAVVATRHPLETGTHRARGAPGSALIARRPCQIVAPATAPTPPGPACGWRNQRHSRARPASRECVRSRGRRARGSAITATAGTPH